jgi:hypothetical protein
MGFGSGPIRALPESAKFIERMKWDADKGRLNIGKRLKDKRQNGTRINTDQHGYQEKARDFFFFAFSNPNGLYPSLSAFICVQ